MPDEIRITLQRTETTFDDRGKPIEQIAIEFHVGEDGPFVRRFTAHEFDGAAARRALDEFARELGKVKGTAY